MFKYLDDKKDIIKNFTPSWFASVMGTGILAILSYFYSQYLPLLEYVGVFLYYFNIALFCVLLIPWSMRWLLFPKEAKADLKHPITTNFYPTIAVGLLVLSADTIIIGKNTFIGTILWLIAALFTIYFSLLVPFVMFMITDVKKEHINPAWFIPPVGLIVVPIPGGFLLPLYSGLFKDLIVIINIACWGAGFFLYLSILAITMYRFFTHTPLPNVLYPTVWINLGPIGAGTTALINIVTNCEIIVEKQTLFSMAFFLWGFGLWWILMAFAMMWRYVRKIKLPYAMSWWAYTFPLGAYVSATHSISLKFNFLLVDYLGFGLYWLLVIFWSVTFIMTLRNSINGKNFVSKTNPKDKAKSNPSPEQRD
ncbi:MAG: tellurite-resistance/dicarboxylate transporter [Promethearchaeota archaeon]